jgi:outer membrane biogenesis lipoprotein LolB
VRISLAFFCLLLAGCATTPPRPYQVEKPKPLPIALDPAFEFRKAKQYFLDPTPIRVTAQTDASVVFERNYRMYGAITALDQRQRYGTYLDFFWRARREADVRVRLEYRQEKLHAFVQAREVRYSLIVNGRIVALTRSYLWE